MVIQQQLKEKQFIDVYALSREYDKIPGQQVDDLLLDGVHPNDKGHEILAEMIYKEWKTNMAF